MRNKWRNRLRLIGELAAYLAALTTAYNAGKRAGTRRGYSLTDSLSYGGIDYADDTPGDIPVGDTGLYRGSGRNWVPVTNCHCVYCRRFFASKAGA